MSLDAATSAAAAASATELVKLLADLAKPPEPDPYIPAYVGLAGVLVGALIQFLGNEFTAFRQRLREVQRARDAGILSALQLARHLETYAFQALDVVVSWNSVEWYEPNKWRCNWDDKPLYVQPLENWPKEIRWEDLAVSITIEVENFRDLTTRERTYLNGIAHFNDGTDQHRENANMAARLAPMAWNLAQSIRKTHDIAPVPHGDGEDIVRLSCEHKMSQKKYEASQQVSLDELDNP